ncbi:hypothetical protein TNCT_653041 [Trichonephila clavata]|uniref:Uncharacterized protein n=1 Tax=Trichonephila clavata TaxID=2740835 RepID=A0A8X6L306_TRICU|nr:hypothetical protein TNCT_653041 [Trichonephila clavata]
MDFSPSKQHQLAAYEKLRDTITGISALHQTLLEKKSLRLPNSRNSFTDLYQMNTIAMMQKKEDLPKSPRPPDLRYFIKAESFSTDVTNTGKNDQRVWSLDCGYLGR